MIPEFAISGESKRLMWIPNGSHGGEKTLEMAPTRAERTEIRRSGISHFRAHARKLRKLWMNTIKSMKIFVEKNRGNSNNYSVRMNHCWARTTLYWTHKTRRTLYVSNHISLQWIARQLLNDMRKRFIPHATILIHDFRLAKVAGSAELHHNNGRRSA